MIEINLIPDVKLELLKARRQRKMVISASIIASIGAAAAVVLLMTYAFGVQTALDALADSDIKKESTALKNVKDLSKTLTIQSQLDQIATSQSEKNVTSRLFDIISVTVPEGKNAVTIKRLAFDSSEKVIEIEAEASNGYEALEVFKKTIAQTNYRFDTEEKKGQSVKISNAISDGERRYSEDQQGRQVLRFTISFEYSDELFDTEIAGGRIIGPDKQKATDSAQGVPTSLFEGGA